MVRSTDEILDLRVKAHSYWHEPIDRFDMLLEAYHGNYQKLWPGEFRRGEAPKIANWIKLAWKRYAAMVGKVPSTHVPPSKLSRISQSKADKIEKVSAHHDNSSVMPKIMKGYSWYLTGFGAGVIGVMPDANIKGPKFFYKDPRAVFPAPGEGSVTSNTGHFSMLTKPDMSVVSMPWVIFDETMTVSTLLDTYPQRTSQILDAIDDQDPFMPVEVVTFMDKETWTVLVNQKKILSIDHGLGFVPVRYTAMTVAGQLGGESMFEQNIGLVLAYTRVLNQKLTYNDNVVWPWLMVRGVHTMDPASRTIKIMDQQGTAEFLDPSGEIQVERDMEVLDRLIRIMNQDTEALRGESPGSTVTGLGLAELNRTITSAVQDFWENMKPDVEFVKSAALIMDEELYGNVKKPMIGKAKGESFEEEYVPRKVINGHHTVTVDFGIGVGGFEGFVELMQFAAQGFIDEQTVMEEAPWIDSVSDTRRRVLIDRLEKVAFEMFAGGAPPQIINHLLRWHEAIQEGKEPWKWLSENPLPVPEPMAGEDGAPLPGSPPPPAPEQLPPEAELAQLMGGGGGAPAVPSVPSPEQIMALAQGRQ